MTGFSVCMQFVFVGNPYPPVLQKPRDLRGTLTNVLIEEMRKDFYGQKYQSHIPEPVQASLDETVQSQNESTDSVNESDSKETTANHSLESETYHKDANIDVKGPKSD